MQIKALLTVLVVSLALSARALATPDHVVNVEEELLASSPTGFVILRTVSDNLGSYFANKVTTYIDEYEKRPGKGPLGQTFAGVVKSTEILRVSAFKDYGPEGPKPVVETLEARNKSVEVSELLLKYPLRPRRWGKEELAKVAAFRAGSSGDVYAGANQLLSSYEICEAVFRVERSSKWEIAEAREDDNCVYMRLTTGVEDESQQGRWICLLPETTGQLHAHLARKPYYMVSGSFKSSAAAVEKAQAILQKTKDGQDSLSGLEVWSVSNPEGTGLTYCIALATGFDHMTPLYFEKLRKIVGQDLAPMSSQFFVSQFPVKLAP